MTAKVGSIKIDSTRTQNGKIIDVWKFKGPFDSVRNFVDKAIQEKFVATIFIHKTESKIWFIASGVLFPKDGLKNENINDLKVMVETIFQEQYAVLTSVSWNPWLEVRVGLRGPYSRGVSGQILSIEYKEISRGVDAEGNVWTISANGCAIKFPEPKRMHAEVARDPLACGIKIDDRDINDELSYIPSTPENIHALEDIESRMKILHSRLSDLLQQENIQENLASFSNIFPQLISGKS